MANLRSSKKDIRRIKRRTLLRRPFKINAKRAVKEVLKLVAEGNLEKAKEALPQAYKAIDKAAKKNIYHPNKAARLKSRIAKAINTAATRS